MVYIFQQLTLELGYADYLGALQRYRVEDLHDPHLLLLSSFLLDYPFHHCLYPQSLDVLKRLGGFGPTVVFSNGHYRFAYWRSARLRFLGLERRMAGDDKSKLAWDLLTKPRTQEARL